MENQLIQNNQLDPNYNNYCFDHCKNYEKHCEECYIKRPYLNFKCIHFIYKNKGRFFGNSSPIPLMNEARNNLCIMCINFVEHTCPITSRAFIFELCKMQKLKFHINLSKIDFEKLEDNKQKKLWGEPNDKF